MKAYILSVAGIILLSATVSIIAPGGKMGKFVKGAMKLFVFVVLISPFTKLVRGETSDFVLSEIGTDEVYLEKCAALLEDEDETAIVAYIEESFGVEAAVSVERGISDGFPREKIRIKITDFGICEQEERIYIMTRIREEVTDRFGCDTEII